MQSTNPKTKTRLLKVRTENLDYQSGLHYFNQIRELTDPVWLDSGIDAKLNSTTGSEIPGRFDILSAEPIDCLSFDPAIDHISERTESTPLRPLRDALASIAKVEPCEDIPFCGGLIGYLSYETNHAQHGISRRSSEKDSDTKPQVVMGLYTWALILDHLKRTTLLIFHPDCPKNVEQKIRASLNSTRSSTLDSGSEQMTNVSPLDTLNFRLLERFQASQSRTDYLDRIAKITNYLSAGDCYQVNLAQHFSASYSGDCAQAYLQLRELTPTPHGAYLGFADRKILSLSPERFIQINQNQVQTWPIKGTAPRSPNPAEDAQLARQLTDSEKNRAENLMIVDLMRNDLSTCCVPGSIRVPGLYELHSFPTVHHLVSRVTGELSESQDPISVLEHSLPGGSITGAPKIRAMQIIAELEERDRGVYCGCIGYLSSCGTMDTNIAIRTLEADGSRLNAWGGGGIVMDSDAESEFQETLDKIQPLLKHLERTL